MVHSQHIKNVPGRNTDAGGSEWLAQLARFGLPRGSFIPHQNLIPPSARASPDFKVPEEISRKLGRRKEQRAQAPTMPVSRHAVWSPMSMASVPANSSKY